MRKVYPTLIILIAVIVLTIIFGVLPLAKEIKNNYSEMISQKKELLLLKMKAENLIKFQQQYLIFHDKLDTVNEVFIDAETPINYLDFLEKLAQDCRLSINISIGSLKKAKTDIWPSLPFQISLAGSYPKIFKFLEKIENSPYLTEVEAFNLKRLTEEETKVKDFEGFSAGDLRVSLTAKVYVKEKEKLGFNNYKNENNF